MGRKKVKVWKCLDKSSCFWKTMNGYCGAPDNHRRVCKTIDGTKLYEAVYSE